MNKIDIVKKIVSVVVGAGTAQIVKGFIQNNTNPEGVKDHLAIASAAVVLGSMATEATSRHTGKMIDEAVAQASDLIKKFKDAKKKAKDSTTEEPALELEATPETETE